MSSFHFYTVCKVSTVEADAEEIIVKAWHLSSKHPSSSSVLPSVYIEIGRRNIIQHFDESESFLSIHFTTLPLRVLLLLLVYSIWIIWCVVQYLVSVNTSSLSPSLSFISPSIRPRRYSWKLEALLAISGRRQKTILACSFSILLYLSFLPSRSVLSGTR